MRKITKYLAMAVLSFMCLAVFLNGSATAQINFSKSNYTTNSGSKIEVPVTLDYTALNTTANETKGIIYTNESDRSPYPNIATSDEIDYISDFDFSTALVVNYSSGITNDVYITLETPVNYFDGIWCKKSQNAYLLITVGNDSSGTYGYPITATGYGDMFYYQNLSYKYITGIEYEMSTFTVADFCDQFGSIDNITIEIQGSEDLMIPDGSAIQDYKNVLIYEFHLFNQEPKISSTSIADTQGFPQAWGLSSERVSGGSWIITVNVPSTTENGAYFLNVTDTLGNKDQTTITVEQNKQNINSWIYFVIFLLLTIGVGALTAILEDSGKNKVFVVVGVAGTVVLAAVDIFVLSEIFGFTHIGLFSAGMIVLGLFGFSGHSKTKEVLRKHKKTATKVFGFMIVASFVIGAFAVASATYKTSPKSISAEAGDIVSITVYDTTGGLNATYTKVYAIQKVDTETPYYVFWYSKTTVADGKESANISITIPASADAGTYTVDVAMDRERTIESSTIYIKEAQGKNFNILAFFEFFAIIFSVVGLIAWGWTQGTKTKKDDSAGVGALIILGFVAVAFMLIGFAYWFSWWDFGFVIHVKAFLQSITL